MTCNKCSKEIPENAAFCGYCGAANIPEQKPVEEKVEEFTVVDTTLEVEAQTADAPKTETIIYEAEKQVEDDAPTVSDENIVITLEPKPPSVSVSADDFVKDRVEMPAVESAHYSHNEASKLNDSRHDAPVKTSTYFWMMLVMAIPFVNLIMLLIWSFSEKINLSRRNFSRAALIWAGIIIAIAIVSLVIAIVSLLTYGNYFATPSMFFTY